MQNINTKKYWESRFKTKSWGKRGMRQTQEYAIANVSHMNINKYFGGSILDFGCALGDAITVYHSAFPNAFLSGFDLSETAIKKCKEKYGNIAEFNSGNFKGIKNQDVIIASHVMEHITDDRTIVKKLLLKCKEMFIFVPYKESPLYKEHVNYYEKNYYNNFNVLEKSVFFVDFKYKLSVNEIIKNLLKGRIVYEKQFLKEIVSFHIKGLL